MEALQRRGRSMMLIWLLATKTVLCAPTPTQAATFSEKTQYPPSAQGARLLAPETEGVYHTALEREGHEWALSPLPTEDSDSTFEWGSLFDNLDEPDSFIDWLFPDQDTPPDAPTEPSPEPGPVPSDSTSDLSVATTTLVSSTASEDVPDSPISSASETDSATEATTSLDSVPPTSTFETHAPQDTSAPMADQDAFVPIGTGPIPAAIPSRDDHPVAKNGVNSSNPIETNKFHSALFLGSQTNATFTHPYSLAWAKGSGTFPSWGMSVSHIEQHQLAYGPTNSLPGNPVSYYINPIGIRSLILSATELSESTVLTAENMLPFSADAVLRPQAGSSQRITIPVVQGMAYVTGVYTQLQPVLQSAVHFRQVVTAGSPRAGIFKYRATLEDDTVWLIYVTPEDGQDPNLQLLSATDLRGPAGWSGTIQVAKNPAGSPGESLFDNSSGVFPVEGVVSGAVNGQTGTYRLAWAKAGKDTQSTPLMMFALPHHVEAFDSQTRGRAVNITLRTTTKGVATAVIGEYWSMTEPDLPTTMDFAPWTVTSGSNSQLSQAAQSVIRNAAAVELQQDMDAQSNLNSMYFSGKALSKFATIIYTVDRLLGDHALAAPALERLKAAFARFAENRQQFPLVYDTVWKGVVSSASYGGDVGADFGNTLYNDHHFHYGYFIHAAAIIGSLDPSWVGPNRDWVNMLVRDSGNAAANDPLFPFSRAFDWYHGHSWAKGLFESYDGKDQESSSEDTMYAYALKMWGKTSGDASLEARGNLMLGILRRSLHNYFLMESDDVNHPSNFIGNKVTGILFENKVDHTTYFGANFEYVQGIHMLPLLPSSPYVRSQKFVREEWDAIFASNAVDPAEQVTGGWKGILYSNLALIDPAASWRFFAQDNFDSSWIDGGASRTWYLAFAAGKFSSVLSPLRCASWMCFGSSAVFNLWSVADVIHDRTRWRIDVALSQLQSSRKVGVLSLMISQSSLVGFVNFDST
ncbi:glycosyl hydrolase family 81-domain-containing protein [Aspergillus granulosus]|uniref:glucan endo-1,3-beta-D-glucosidase n=1 Tax=Aspergillus granulosus TaxID=176169 RepID=A0ABR4I528_9EURO